MFRLAHVTDPHFRAQAGTIAGLRAGDLVGKRALGALNLVVNRRRKFKMDLLADLAVDLRARRPDHVALTGDLGNISLQAEWTTARTWIEGLECSPEAVTVIPGNHDAYVEDVVKSGAFETTFAAYQTADVRLAGHHYPFVRLRGDVALIGVNTCVATGDFGAWGQIGGDQLARLGTLLSSPALAGKVRVVLLHHPPVLMRPPESRNLRDRADFIALLGRVGADLVLHGHDHRDERVDVPGPGGGQIPIVGAGSASYAGAAERRSRYNVYEIEGRAITAITYAHDEATDVFRQVRREVLAPGVPVLAV